MRFLVALFALLLACTPLTDVRMHPAAAPVSVPTFTQDVLVDDAFDAGDYDAIAGAVYTWNQTFAGALNLRVNRARMSVGAMATGSILIMRVDSACPFIPYAPAGEHTVAFSNRVGGHQVWLVRDRLESWHVQGVTLHELGHVFGAEDRRDVEGLMFIPTGPSQWGCVDKATAAEVARAQGLPLEALAYCERVPRSGPAEDDVTAYPPL